MTRAATGGMVAALLMLIANVPSARLVEQPAGAALVVDTPVAPIPVRGTDGRVHFAVELRVSHADRSVGSVRLERVEAYGDADAVSADTASADAAPLVTYQGTDLDGRVMRPGASPDARFGRSIESGTPAVIHVWITLQNDRPAPKFLRHRVVFVTGGGAEQAVDLRTGVRSATRIVIGPPLRKGTWLAHNGPGNHRAAHWGSVLPPTARATIPQRFAVDFIGLDANGRAVRGDFRTSANADWIGFGAEVIAAAAGIVRDVRDGMPDNAPMAPVSPPAAPTAAATYGNYVVVDIGSGRFAHYAHLQRNSVSVKAGQRVRRGQLLGRLGNSGNTNAPHLHFMVTDAAAFEDSEGLPFVVDLFDMLGETTAERAVAGEPAAGTPNTSPQTRRRELPLDGAVVRFGPRSGGRPR